MAITKVWIEDGCISCGNCEAVCSKVFQVIDVSEVQEGVNFSDYEAEIKEACEDCPVSVIHYE